MIMVRAEDTEGYRGHRVEPATFEELSAILLRASRERQRVTVRGSGTKLGWGPTRPTADIEISTARMNAVVAHRHGDLTATIQAGARLADCQVMAPRV